MGIEKYKNYSEAHKTALQLVGSEEKAIEREVLALLIHHYDEIFTLEQLQNKLPGIIKKALEDAVNSLLEGNRASKKRIPGEEIIRYTVNEGSI